MGTGPNAAPAWVDARRRMNEALRRRFAEQHGEGRLEALIGERTEAALGGWLAPYLESKALAKASSRNGSVEEEIVSRVRPYLARPAVLAGADVAAMAAALGVDRAFEMDEWRLPVARSAFPEIDILGGNFLDRPEAPRTLVALRLLETLERTGGFGRLRDFFAGVGGRLAAGASLLLVDARSYQDDAVCQLAALQFEIDEIAPLGDGRTSLLRATKFDLEE